MHELLQDMAKEIIRNESPREPGQRSRIWFHEDVLHILNENTGTDNIEGIKIDLPEPEKVVDLAKALAKMKKLRLLMVYNAHISDEIHYLSDELSCCEFLTEIPDFSMVPNLESLNLDNCTNLFKVHESVGSLDKLVTLSLLFCSILRILPSCFKLRSLHTLSLTGCCKLRKFPGIAEKMEHLIEILLQGTGIKELPDSIEHLIGLRYLYLEFCQKLEYLPSGLHKLQDLTSPFLTGCSNLREVPKLPLNIRCIEASDCISLERFPQLSSPSSFTPEDSERLYEMRNLIVRQHFQGARSQIGLIIIALIVQFLLKWLLGCAVSLWTVFLVRLSSWTRLLRQLVCFIVDVRLSSVITGHGF
ncbi:hypothetical protein L6164_006283 [Bauhinia variegata]|uniref:Uncharacterized protein n=1 Tax=Bauhinia variegata TaxID=167791 RepID=A0ACB9PU00_BAUVA|nr:hypothetical protein L6164_006283 [Bauhinia variegata]